MTEIWTQAALWLGLALIATLVSIWLRVATALSEIVVGTIAQLIIGAAFGSALLAGDASWLKFLAGAGAILLTFLAGAELDPVVFRRQWKQASLIGLVSFAAPFLGCAAIARWGLGWTPQASWLAGIAMSIGLLTPFYFIRAGSLVSLPALVAAPAAFLVLLSAKMVTKVAGIYPVTRALKSPRQEGMYTTLLMSTGLTFGTISALFGLSHQIVSPAQYSALVAAVVGSAVVPTLIANAFFLPRHLLNTDAEQPTVQPEPPYRKPLRGEHRDPQPIGRLRRFGIRRKRPRVCRESRARVRFRIACAGGGASAGIGR
jgi:Kef-type K+ transport system membrane component KefB